MGNGVAGRAGAGAAKGGGAARPPAGGGAARGAAGPLPSASPPGAAASRPFPPPHLVKAKYMRLTMVKLSSVMVCGR